MLEKPGENHTHRSRMIVVGNILIIYIQGIFPVLLLLLLLCRAMLLDWTMNEDTSSHGKIDQYSKA